MSKPFIPVVSATLYTTVDGVTAGFVGSVGEVKRLKGALTDVFPAAKFEVIPRVRWIPNPDVWY